MRLLAVLVASAIGLSTNLHAQESRTPREPGPIAESADRIAREWWPTEPASFTIDEQGRPRFRAGTTETLLAPPWQLSPDDQLTLAPARGAISHREMMRIMTPQEFSTPLFSVTTDPGAMYNAMKKAWREWQARRIHERVEKEVEELERLRKANEEND